MNPLTPILTDDAVTALTARDQSYPLNESLKQLADAEDTPAHVRDWLLRMANPEHDRERLAAVSAC